MQFHFRSLTRLGHTLALLITMLALMGACGPAVARPGSLVLPTAVIALATAPLPPTALPPVAFIPTVTAVPSPTPGQPWRFVILGDTRTQGLDPPEVTSQIVVQAAAAHPAMVLAVGDLINALNTPDEVRQQWQNWRAVVAPLVAVDHGSPWLLPTPGNHDVQSGSWAAALFTEAFPELPTNGPAGLERRTYLVDYRGVRFISLDSERLEAMHLLDEAQLTWLETQLRNNPNHAKTIVFSHDPAYPIGPHIGSSLDVYPQVRDRFWALLRQYGVTAYIAGHEHLYNHQVIDGVHQIIAGTSGSFVYAGSGGEFYHYVVGEVSSTSLTFTVYDQAGQQRDRFTIP